MKCRDFHEMIDSYLSDELLTETNHDVLRHLENCSDCRNVIEARREVRSRLQSAVMKAPQYQMDNNFAHNLRTQLKYEAMSEQTTKSSSWFGFGSWAAVTAGLVLTFTLGFILINNSNGVDTNEVVSHEHKSHQTEKVPQNNIVNIAFDDHQYCAIKFDSDHPVKLAKTPEKYKDVEKVALPKLDNVLADYKVKKSHTCQFNNTEFTHVVLSKGDNTVSLMLTEKRKADNFGDNIASYSSEKYELSRFDVNETSVFVISGLDKKINSEIANTLYNPMQKYLKKGNQLQTSLLFYY